MFDLLRHPIFVAFLQTIFGALLALAGAYFGAKYAQGLAHAYQRRSKKRDWQFETIGKASLTHRAMWSKAGSCLNYLAILAIAKNPSPDLRTALAPSDLVKALGEEKERLNQAVISAHALNPMMNLLFPEAQDYWFRLLVNFQDVVTEHLTPREMRSKIHEAEDLFWKFIITASQEAGLEMTAPEPDSYGLSREQRDLLERALRHTDQEKSVGS